DQRTEKRNKRTVACVSLGGKAEEAELAALTIVMEKNGYAVMNLGAGVTTPAVTQFLTRTKPYAVILYASFPSSANETVDVIEFIAESANANGTRCITAGCPPGIHKGTSGISVMHVQSFAEWNDVHIESAVR
ncbi:MAG: hypothetical protein HUU02_12930, partial [Bacteroidetes bacterium]|nr:hypothetical protein [Bacteroidota bacterium]